MAKSIDDNLSDFECYKPGGCCDKNCGIIVKVVGQGGGRVKKHFWDCNNKGVIECEGPDGLPENVCVCDGKERPIFLFGSIPPEPEIELVYTSIDNLYIHRWWVKNSSALKTKYPLNQSNLSKNFINNHQATVLNQEMMNKSIAENIKYYIQNIINEPPPITKQDIRKKCEEGFNSNPKAYQCAWPNSTPPSGCSTDDFNKLESDKQKWMDKCVSCCLRSQPVLITETPINIPTDAEPFRKKTEGPIPKLRLECPCIKCVQPHDTNTDTSTDQQNNTGSDDGGIAEFISSYNKAKEAIGSTTILGFTNKSMPVVLDEGEAYCDSCVPPPPIFGSSNTTDPSRLKGAEIQCRMAKAICEMLQEKGLLIDGPCPDTLCDMESSHPYDFPYENGCTDVFRWMKTYFDKLAEQADLSDILDIYGDVLFVFDEFIEDIGCPNNPCEGSDRIECYERALQQWVCVMLWISERTGHPPFPPVYDPIEAAKVKAMLLRALETISRTDNPSLHEAIMWLLALLESGEADPLFILEIILEYLIKYWKRPKPPKGM